MQGLLSNNLLSKNSLFGNSNSDSNIKSVQRGTAVITTSSTTTTVTLTSVDTTKSIVEINFSAGATSDAARQKLVKAVITNATTLTLSVSNVPSANFNVTWEVIEYNNVKSLQTGTLLLSSASTAAITSVNLSKSSLIYSFSTTNATNNAAAMTSTGILTSSTLLSFITPYLLESIAWQVIEFN